ncbi:MAG: hypothetical protein G8237_08240 [Magnetococcales bacterium]|nr:hypothetical protein [Magnetococcales bacterium]
MKKMFGLAMLVVACVAMPIGTGWTSAADDKAWVADCIMDNANEGQSPKVVETYCKCMVELMPENTNQTVSQWEKTHRKEEAVCSAKAGWKD